MECLKNSHSQSIVTIGLSQSHSSVEKLLSQGIYQNTTDNCLMSQLLETNETLSKRVNIKPQKEDLRDKMPQEAE